MENKKRISPKKKKERKKETPEYPAPDSSEKPGAEKDQFPIVGIGASAGGLEAFQQFLSKMPADSGMSFVLISHLDPEHPSLLSDILGKSTRMRIIEARDGVRIEPNEIYVIPPNKDLSIFKRTLYLTLPLEPRGKRMPIDFFMRSLAEDQGENAVCIILSGTGSDGSLGIKAIHEKNGLIIVQDPDSASYDGMPRNAIRTGLVDNILAPGKMPDQLITYMKQFRPSGEKKPLGALPQILSILRAKTGHDFSHYKPGTISRRIEKRMGLHKIEDPLLYVRFIQENPSEVRDLFNELLICVTSFFRDPKAFEALKTKGLPAIMDHMGEPKRFRAWIPGCATGEEAYSIAIILKEYMGEHGLDFPVQIFATDINESAINYARTGVYPENIALDVGPERLKKFFSKEAKDYRLKKNIREMVIFAIQNVVQDVPFTHLDLLSCRNLLIYLGPELQDELVPRFHYSLNNNGILFLGTAEGIGRFHDLFSPLDRKWKLFRARDVGREHGGYGLLHRRHYHETGHEAGREAAKKINLADVSQQILLKHFIPLSLLVNEKFEIVYLQGDTGNYFRLPSGEPSRNILDSVRESLRPVLSSGIYNAISKKKESSFRNVEVKVNGTTERVNVFIRPAEHPDLSGMALAMVVMESALKTVSGPEKEKKSSREKGRLREVEEELASTRERLNTTIEEMQASGEEMKSTNEELQSANEELQSTNEELESSKEELQSMNEELSTLNSEMQAKMDELIRAESDFRILLDSTKIGIIFLDNQLRIKRFTESAAQVISLISSDVGRPLSDIVKKFRYDELYKDAQKVMDTLAPRERQIQTQTGDSYLLRIVPYRTIDNVIDGVVITFTNVTELKKSIEKLAT